MINKYKDAILLILIGIVSAISGIFANIAANTIPEQWKPYLWVSWPLFGVFTITGIALAFWQSRTSDKSLPNLSQTQEQRNRQAMLKLVYNTWVVGVLKKSLFNEVLLELGMETRPDAIDRPWDIKNLLLIYLCFLWMNWNIF